MSRQPKWFLSAASSEVYCTTVVIFSKKPVIQSFEVVAFDIDVDL